jgi:hypothetical protein
LAIIARLKKKLLANKNAILCQLRIDLMIAAENSLETINENNNSPGKTVKVSKSNNCQKLAALL